MNLTQKVQEVLAKFAVEADDLFDGGVEWESSPMFTQLEDVFADEMGNQNNGDTAGWLAEKVWGMFNR